MDEIISAIVLLILIMDPFGNLPIFMSVLKHIEPKGRRAIMVRELLIALLVTLVFLSAGEKILAFLGLRAEAASIFDGIILSLIVIRMISPSVPGNSSESSAGEEPFTVPLTILLIARPIILAALTLLSHQYLNQMGHLVIILLLAWGSTSVILLQSSLPLRLLGEKGVSTLGRLMGLILVMMATQVFLDGIRVWMRGQGSNGCCTQPGVVLALLPEPVMTLTQSGNPPLFFYAVQPHTDLFDGQTSTRRQLFNTYRFLCKDRQFRHRELIKIDRGMRGHYCVICVIFMQRKQF